MRQLRFLLKYLRSYIPENLPVGRADFDSFASDIIELSGPYADRDSMLYVIAGIITSLGHGKSRVSKQLFVRHMRKAAANQVASTIFLEIRQKQAEAVAKQQAEATAKLEAVNGKEAQG